MGVSETEFRKLYVINTTATVVTRNAFKEISGITIQVKGIRGGERYDAGTTLWYTVFIDVENIRSETIPSVYVINPPDENIRHVNIFHPSYCNKLRKGLPSICWGDMRVTGRNRKNTIEPSFL